jgi:hypothetical protein
LSKQIGGKTWVFSNLKLSEKYDFTMEKFFLEEIEMPKKLIVKIITLQVQLKFDLRCDIRIDAENDEVQSTKIVKGTNIAHYNQLLVFDMPSKTCNIILEVKDKSKKETFLGKVVIPIQEISILKSKKYKLVPHEKNKDLKLPGEVELKFFLNNVYNIHQDDIFGIPLITVMEREHETGVIPNGISKVIDFLAKTSTEIKGIFRISATVKDVEILQYRLDQGDIITFNEDDESEIHSASNVLKLYFRDLPDPLCTLALYDSFLKIDAKQDPKQIIPIIKDLIYKLPEEHRCLFIHLFTFLKKVIARKDVNLMAEDNIAVVFAPNILRDEKPTDLNKITKANQVISALLKYYPDYIDENDRLN